MDAFTTRPLDWLADFPAIPEGWAYLDTAATAQKPRVVIDAIARGYAQTYATVHRGVYQRSADMTLAFEASRRRVAAFLNAAAHEDDLLRRGGIEEGRVPAARPRGSTSSRRAGAALI